MFPYCMPLYLTSLSQAQWVCILSAMIASAAYALHAWIRKTCACYQTPNEDRMVVKVEGAKE